jgi:8-oxo-dGTP pyrophosphatase MutT (NUDIX family)
MCDFVIFLKFFESKKVSLNNKKVSTYSTSNAISIIVPMNLDILKQKLRHLDTITPENIAITDLEKEIIAQKEIPAIICAVVVLLFLHEEEFYLTLIQRPKYDGTHSGQIAFAGGKKDTTDKTLLATALRECSEEIGVELSEKHILGALADVYIVPSHSLVTPFVAYLPEMPSYVPSPREVDKVLQIKLNEFINPANQRMQSIKVLVNKEIKLPAYLVDGHNVWGATGRMISMFLDLWDK